MNPYFEDYRRATLSLPVRSQKDKTQVFSLDEKHFVRTRLSHSYEVSVTASRILSESLYRFGKDDALKHEDNSSDLPVDSLQYALMAACLLHDAGNPPFGHVGESAIRAWFADHGPEVFERMSEAECADLRHFEGNANSLRIALTPSCMYDGRRLNLTATTIGALVKYPRNSTSCRDAADNREYDKFNFFQSDMPLLKRLQAAEERFGSEAKIASMLLAGKRHPLSFFLEAADDIAYATSDIEDAFRKRRVSVPEMVRFMLKELEGIMLSPADPKGREAESGFGSNAAKSTFTLITLLALMAGSKEDVDECRAFFEKHDDVLSGFFKKTSEGIRVGNDTCGFLEIGDDLVPEAHAFVNADSRASLEASEDARQLQETYVSRWIDVVRDWLCFSAAKSLSEELGNLSERCFSDDDAERDFGQIAFERHVYTMDVLKKLQKRFVYDAMEGTERNAHADKVLRNLLDVWVPSALRCADSAIDPVSLTGQSDDKGGKPCVLRNSDCVLMRLIPLRYRMDCRDRLEKADDVMRPPSRRYEYTMMVLDYISSLTDSEATSLSELLC